MGNLIKERVSIRKGFVSEPSVFYTESRVVFMGKAKAVCEHKRQILFAGKPFGRYGKIRMKRLLLCDFSD